MIKKAICYYYDKMCSCGVLYKLPPQSSNYNTVFNIKITYNSALIQKIKKQQKNKDIFCYFKLTSHGNVKIQT